PGEILKQPRLRGRKRRLADRLDHAGQPLVHLPDAGEIEQHTLVNGERRAGEPASASLNEAPAPEGRARRQGAPVRLRKSGQSQAEGRKWPRRVALDRRAKTREP